MAAVEERTPTDVGVLPREITGMGPDLVCPGAGVCVATGSNDEGLAYFMNGSDGGRTWTASLLPGSTGTDSYVLGMACTSTSFCYAWGGTSGATVWWTTTPGSGGWQAKVLTGAYGVDTMSCAAPGVCVAATTVGGDVRTSNGTAWYTADIGSDAWAPQPLDLAYRVVGIECPSASTCVAWGQGAAFPGHFQTDPTLWSTADAAGGGWLRVLPVADGSGSSYAIKSVDCPTVSLCVANGVSAWSSGLTSQFYSGYWATTNPASSAPDDWQWHQGEGSPFERGPLSCLSAEVCLSWDGAQTMSFAPDPTDREAPVPLALPAENYLRLGGFGCFAADRCHAWGTDSGAASSGPLMRTRLWRGSSLGGAWTVAPLPSTAAHEDRIPHGQVACNAATCTAVGVLLPSGLYADSIGPVVWVTGPDGSWRVAAAAPSLVPGADGAVDAAKVPTKVTLRARPATGRPARLSGRVTAERGCARARTVTLVARNGGSAKRVRSDKVGRFAITLTPGVRGKLGQKGRVSVERKKRDEIVCLAARSKRIRVR